MWLQKGEIRIKIQKPKCGSRAALCDLPIFDETRVKLDFQLAALLHHLDGAAVGDERLHGAQHVAAAPAAVLRETHVL
jgi:hypothetical protein